MIKNEKEYAAAKARRDSFERALSEFDVAAEVEAGVDPAIARAQRDSFSHHLDRLVSEIRRYEILQSGSSNAIALDTINELGHSLVQARIAKGWTQKNLAERIGIKEQQVQRYERDLYKTANLKRLSLVCQGLSVRFEGFLDVQAESPEESSFLFGISLADFPYSEVVKKGWVEGVQNAKGIRDEQKASGVLRYFSQSPALAGEVLHRKASGSVNAARRAALFMWQARILMRAEEKAHKFPQFEPLSFDAIDHLVKLSVLEDGPLRAVEFLERHGVIVVFDEHLSKTKLDGAALSLNHKQAVIGMSLRHDRLDNFWFVLLHELGHLMRHWQKVSQFGIIDEDVGHESSELFEREADEFARNAIIADERWRSSLVRYASDPQSIIKFASRMGLHPALIAGRVRYERGYSLFNNLIGQGEVRKMMYQAGRWEPSDAMV